MISAISTKPHTARAVAHVHSQWSYDASWSLSRIAAVFSRMHYSVVLMSEHSRGFTFNQMAGIHRSMRGSEQSENHPRARNRVRR